MIDIQQGPLSTFVQDFFALRMQAIQNSDHITNHWAQPFCLTLGLIEHLVNTDRIRFEVVLQDKIMIIKH